MCDMGMRDVCVRVLLLVLVLAIERASATLDIVRLPFSHNYDTNRPLSPKSPDTLLRITRT
jgi:hypothetical protein